VVWVGGEVLFVGFVLFCFFKKKKGLCIPLCLIAKATCELEIFVVRESLHSQNHIF